MNLNDYQEKAWEFARFPGADTRFDTGATALDLAYASLKLNGEAGEVAEKVGKIIRDQEGVITKANQEALLKELGDVLWYVNALAVQLNSSLSEVARLNLEKLSSRAERGVLGGSGDDR